MSGEAWPRYFHPDGHEITAEEFDAAYDEAQAPRGNSIMRTDANGVTPRPSPINEAGISATFAAIFARLESLQTGLDLHEVVTQPIFARLDALEADVFAVHGYAERDEVDALSARLERLESARIAAPVAPESAETASEVPMEPGNATEALSEALRKAHDLAFNAECVVRRMRATDAEVLAALRMYRKAQGCRTLDDGVSVEINASEHWYETAAGLLAWLKEGEA